MKHHVKRLLALLLLVLVPAVLAHNLDQQNSRISYEQQTVDLMAARAASGSPLLQVGDTISLILKATPGPGTATGAGGYLTFFIPEGTQVVSAEYGTLNTSGSFVPLPVKGPAINAIGDGSCGTFSTAALAGLILGPNILGNTSATVTSSGAHNGTIAGVYADTGVFYSTDPRTVYNSFVNTGGYDRLLSSTTDNLMTNNSGDTIIPTTLWDAEQLIAFGMSRPATPIIDPDGRGNSPWGMASGVAGPESGYGWEFNWSTWLSGTGVNRMKNSIKVGPWKRLKYPGSQASFDTPGLKSIALGYAAVDASTLGASFPLPETLDWTDSTSPKAVRISLGLLELGRPEFARVKLKILKGPGVAKSPFNAQGAFTAYSDAFGGDAGGELGGKDHLWRYYNPVRLDIGTTVVLQKIFAKPYLLPNEISSFKLQIINTGSAALTNVTVTDPLPAGMSYLSASMAPSSTAPLTWKFPSIAPYSTVTFTVNFQATALGTITNTAYLTSDQQAVSARDTVEVASKAILDVDKTVTPSTVEPGATVTYTLTMKNNGTGANGTPLVITENLPSVFTYTGLLSAKLNGAVAPAGVVTVSATDAAKPVFTVSQAIQPGKTLELVFTALVSASQPAGVYGNTVSYSFERKTLASPSLAPVTVVGGRIGDTVFRDWNGNGVQDSGDDGIPGIVVRLFASNGTTLLATGTTNLSGGYLFSGISSGTYVVRTSNIPADYAQTYDADGIGTANQSTIILGQNEANLAQDFGYKPVGSGAIGDTVFEDVDADGIYTLGVDVPLPDVKVSLYQDSNGNGLLDTGTTDRLLSTTSSNTSGLYSFTELLPGKYLSVVDVADVDVPSRLIASRSVVAVTLTSGQNFVDADFPFVPSLRKTVDKASVTASGTLTYTINPLYSGSQRLTNLIVSDSIPSGASYVNGSVSSSGTYISTPPARVQWSLGSNTAGSPGLFSSQVTTTGTLTSVADTYADLSAANITKNFGTATTMLMTGSPNRFSYLRFAFPPAGMSAGTIITSATLTLDIADITLGSKTTATWYEVKENWGETTLTGSSQPAVSTTGTATMVDVWSKGPISADVTGMAQAWVNSGTSYGLVGKFPSATSGGVFFTTREGVSAKRPVLVYTYSAGNVSTKTSLTTNRSLVTGTSAQSVTVTVTYETKGNTGTGTITAPTLLTVATTGSQTVTKVSGPTLASGTSTLTSGSGTVSYNYVYNITPGTAPGNVTFSAAAAATSGTGFPTFPSAAQFVSGTSQSVLTVPNLSFRAIALGTVDPITNNAQIKDDSGTIPLKDSNTVETKLPSGIGDFFFYDTNMNGVADAGETGVPGAVVTLYGDTNGNGSIDFGEPLLSVKSTGSNGYYLFENLLPGKYVVKAEEQHVVAPPSSPNAGTYGSMQGTAGTSRAVTLGAGQQYLLADIGFAEIAVVEGHVFYDINSNGFFDTGETPLPNVPVYITGTAINGSIINRSTLTDADGEYGFTVPAGVYTVRYDTSSAAIPAALSLATTRTSFLISVAAGQEVEDLDFGRDNNGTIGDLIWCDVNENGDWDDGEPGLPNICVALFSDSGLTNLIASTVTDATGIYRFTGLADGTYYVQVQTNSLPGKYKLTPTGDPDASKDSKTTVILSGTGGFLASSVVDSLLVLTADFGYPPNTVVRSVSGYVFKDLNKNGSPNTPTESLAGVQVTAWVDTDRDGIDDLSFTISTDSNGKYVFNAIPDGSNVRITVDTVPENLQQTVDPDAVLDSATKLTNVTSDVTNKNFGYVAYGTIYGHVYYDTNSNGRQDAGEPNLPNVDILITDALGQLSSVTTDANGDWTATVPPGSTKADVDETDPDFTNVLKPGYFQTEGTDPTTVTSVLGSNVNAGNDGYVNAQPGLTLVKSGTVATGSNGIVDAGDRINYSFVVSNTGNVTFTNVTLSDSNATISGGPIASLAPGASDSTTFTGYHIITQTELNSGTFTNIATVSGKDPGNNTTTATGTNAQPLAQLPGLTLVKTGTVASGSNGIVDAGDRINYSFVVSNTGNVTLTNITLSDTNAVITGTLASLAPGASNNSAFTGYHAITQVELDSGTFTNIATVSGKDPKDNTVTANDDHVQPFIQLPGLTLVKTGTVATGSNGILDAGDRINYSFVVSNTGNVTLTNITLSDTNAVITGTLASLAPGSSNNSAFTGSHIITQAELNSGTFTNIATVSGKDPKNNTSTATDDHVQPLTQNPGLTLIKTGTVNTGSNGILDAGDRIEYTFVVSNTGNVTLTNITLSDSNAVISGGPIASLDPGASDSSTFTGYHAITQIELNSGTFTNIARVSGKDPKNNTVTTTDDHVQPLTQNPGMTLVKSGTIATGSNGILDAGDRINYTFVVSNTGNVTLTNITLSDTNAVISGTLASLAPGTSNDSAFTGHHIITQTELNSGTFTNVATVSGKDPKNNTSTATDDHVQPFTQNPGLSLIKTGTVNTGSNGILDAGDRIEYTFVVSNTGNVTLTNLVLSDSNAVITGTLASLAPGISNSVAFTGYHAITQIELDSGTFTNIASVSGKDPRNNTATASDDHVQPFIQRPGLTLVKTGTVSSGSNGILEAGDQINYSFVVSNTGNVTLTNITLSDSNATINGGPIVSLAPGASDSTTFTGSHTLTQTELDSGTFTNIAYARGKDPKNNDVTGSDDDTRTLNPQSSIDLLKKGMLQTGTDGLANPGDKITYTFTVTNTGQTTLTNITLSDSNATISGGPIASLAPGASDSTTFTGSHTLTQTEIDSGSFSNTAKVTGKDPKGNNVTDTDTHLQKLDDPGIDLTKTGTVQLGANGRVDAGDKIIYNFTVTNIGNVTLTNVTLSDSNATITGGPIASLAAGQTDSTTFKGERVLTQADVDAGTFTNTATVSGVDPGGKNQSASDENIVNLAQKPGLILAKIGTLDTGSNGILDVGDVITYAFVVSNTGNVTISNITLSDSNAVITGGPIASLAPGTNDSTTFTAVHTITSADIAASTFRNVATVKGKDPKNNDVQASDDDTQDLSGPSIDLQKTGTLNTGTNGRADAGDKITYAFTVKNTGNVTLTNITLSDTSATIGGGPIASLAPGASNNSTFTGEYTLTQADVDAGTFTNIALVKGKDPRNRDVTDTDDDTRTLTAAPSLDLQKTGTVQTGSNGVLEAGDTITYTFRVANTGNLTLTNITVSDTNAVITGTIATLAPGAVDSTTITGVHTITSADMTAGTFTNLATAKGKDPNGNDVTDTDDDTRDLSNPGIDLQKTGTLQSGTNSKAGDKILYNFVITNTGNLTLTNIVLSDSNAVLSGSTVASLAPGASTTLTGYHTLTQRDLDAGTFTNIAKVRGKDSKNVIVEDTDDDTQNLDSPGLIDLTKIGTLQTGTNGRVDAGEKIIYEFTITNIGKVTLSNIVLTDTNAVLATGTIASLDPGKSTKLTGTHTVTQAEIDAGTFTNTALVKGKDPQNREVSDPGSDTRPLTRVPGLDLQKIGVVDSGTNGIVDAGERINYTFVVSNTGNVTLTNITVTDTNAVISGGPIASLAPGARDTTTFTGYHVLTQTEIDSGSFSNIAIATGKDPAGNDVVDEGSDTRKFLYDISGSTFNRTTPNPGVRVRLLDSTGRQIAEATTDSQGRYSFTDLPNGSYKVVEVNPAGVVGGSDADGDNCDEINVVLRGSSVVERDFVDIFADPIQTYTYCRNVIIVNPFNGLPPGNWSLVSVSSIRSGSIKLLADGRVQFTPRSNFYGNFSDSFTVRLRDGNGSEFDRRIDIDSIESIGGTFQSMCQAEATYDPNADPRVLPAEVMGLMQVSLNRDAILAARVVCGNETLQFTGPLSGTFIYRQTVLNRARQARTLELYFDIANDRWTARLSGAGITTTLCYPTRTRTTAGALAGTYTLVLADEADRDNVMGCATATVGPTGAVTLSGALSRGSTFTTIGQLMGNGLSYFYHEPLLAIPNGFVFTMLMDWSGSGPVFNGTAEWRVQKVTGYGVTWEKRRLTARMVRYFPMGTTTPVLGQWSMLNFAYDTGTSVTSIPSITTPISSIQNGRVGSDIFNLTLVRTTGSWSGTMTRGVLRIPLRGVTVQPSGEAIGFGILPSEPQPVWLLKP